MSKETKFKTIVDANRDRMYRICCCYIHDAQERSDVYQKVLIHVWNSLDAFKGESQISTWLFRITINTCFSALRTDSRKKQLFLAISDQHREALADPVSAEESYQMQDDVRILYACINELDGMDKALISLYLEDMNTREMAEIVGISEGNVRVKLHRIKKSLKHLLENRGYESR
jgi:RNA polymerase sigma-70 factor (ECF subfamily)